MNYKQGLTRNIKLYYLSSFFSGLIFIIPIWVAFQRRFLNYTQMAYLESAGMATIMFLELPTGALADLIGRRLTIIFGLFFRVIGFVVKAFSINALMLIIGFLLGSVGSALISGADEALIYDTLKETNNESKYQKIAGKKNLYFQSGLIIATLLGGYLYKYWIGLPYIAEGLAELVAIIGFFMMVEPQIDSIKFTLHSYINQTKAGLKELFKNEYVKKLSIFYVLVGGITWSSQYFFNQPFATDIGFNEIEKSWLFSAIRIINAIVLFKITNVKKIITKKRAFIFTPLLMIAFYLPGIWTTKLLGIILLTGVTFVGSARFVILGQYTNVEFTSRNRATAISSLNLLVSFVFILLVTFSGKIMDLYSTKFIYTILGILSTIIVLPMGINLAKKHNQ